jgi:hypothetical protein
MITRRGWLVVLIAGVLAIVGVIVAQTKKTESAKPNVVAVNRVITVDTTGNCVDMQSAPAHTNGTNVNDTVEWVPKLGSRITDFHIIFIGKSPSAGTERHFSMNNKQFTVIANPANDAEDFPYAISVDAAAGHTSCDPHVIIIKGTGFDIK